MLWWAIIHKLVQSLLLRSASDVSCCVIPSRGISNAPQRTATMRVPRPRISRQTANYISRPSHLSTTSTTQRAIHTSPQRLKPILEPRLEDHGQIIHDKYSVIRDNYGISSIDKVLPKYRIKVLTLFQMSRNTQLSSLMACSVLTSYALPAPTSQAFSTGEV